MTERLGVYEEHKGNYLKSHDITTLRDYRRQLEICKAVHTPMQSIDLVGLQAIAAA